MKDKRKIEWAWLSGGSIADDFTNSDGQQGILIIGDSTAGYATDDTYGPTPTSGTVYEFNGTDIVEVGATDLINVGFAGAGRGSMWPKMGIDYNTGSNRKPVFVDTHAFDSNLLWATDAANKWLYDATSYFKGDLYDAMKIKADAALLSIGVSKFKAIWIMLSVNDIGDNLFTAAQINGAYNKLIEYLQVDYPGSPIYLVAPSVINAGTTTQTALESDVRWHIINTVPTLYTGVECAYYAQYAVACNLQTGAHWNSVMNIYMGASFAAYMLDTETNSYIKRVTNHFTTPLSAAHKLAWKTALEGLQTEGFLQVCNYLKMDIATTALNERFNITGVTQPTFIEGNAYEFIANDCIRTGNNGATSWQSIMFVPSMHTKYGDENNQWIANYGQQNYSVSYPTGGANTVFGSGGSGWYLGQTSNGLVRYRSGDGTNTDFVIGGPTFPDNTWGGVLRTVSTDKSMTQGSTIKNTAVIGGSVLNTGRMSRGGGLGATLINMKHECFFVASGGGYSQSNVLTILNTLRTALRS